MARAERAIFAAAVAAEVVVMSEWCQSHLADNTQSSSGWWRVERRMSRDDGVDAWKRQDGPSGRRYVTPPALVSFPDRLVFRARSEMTGSGHG